MNDLGFGGVTPFSSDCLDTFGSFRISEASLQVGHAKGIECHGLRMSQVFVKQTVLWMSVDGGTLCVRLLRRRITGENKRRFVSLEQDFDLDLVYITWRPQLPELPELLNSL